MFDIWARACLPLVRLRIPLVRSEDHCLSALDHRIPWLCRPVMIMRALLAKARYKNNFPEISGEKFTQSHLSQFVLHFRHCICGIFLRVYSKLDRVIHREILYWAECLRHTLKMYTVFVVSPEKILV